ncbi:uncharacterized protein LOC135822926 [Sycon ciliatum]|uniref:uncharacterized protein LOC135822926 n=1 Tax=Sycon ciliatum TaxID=27933 RepID=UPI0031F69B8C
MAFGYGETDDSAANSLPQIDPKGGAESLISTLARQDQGMEYVIPASHAPTFLSVADGLGGTPCYAPDTQENPGMTHMIPWTEQSQAPWVQNGVMQQWLRSAVKLDGSVRTRSTKSSVWTVGTHSSTGSDWSVGAAGTPRSIPSSEFSTRPSPVLGTSTPPAVLPSGWSGYVEGPRHTPEEATQSTLRGTDCRTEHLLAEIDQYFLSSTLLNPAESPPVDSGTGRIDVNQQIPSNTVLNTAATHLVNSYKEMFDIDQQLFSGTDFSPAASPPVNSGTGTIRVDWPFLNAVDSAAATLGTSDTEVMDTAQYPFKGPDFSPAASPPVYSGTRTIRVDQPFVNAVDSAAATPGNSDKEILDTDKYPFKGTGFSPAASPPVAGIDLVAFSQSWLVPEQDPGDSYECRYHGLRRRRRLPVGDREPHFVCSKCTAILHTFFRSCQYPTVNQKRSLLTQVGMERRQLDNWFCNKRRQMRRATASPSSSEQGSPVLRS